MSDEARIHYFMSHLNGTIFEEDKSSLMNLSTRALFPINYEDLNQRIIAEYSLISTCMPQTVL